MPWNETIRKRYERIPMGYSSDVTDGQWTVVSRLLPGRNRLAHPRKGALRDIWNAIRYIAASGCARSLLPKDFPPVSTVRCYFHRWRDNGLLHEVNRALAAMARCAQSRSGSPGQEKKFINLIVRLAQLFSGDDVQDSSDLRAVLSDVGGLPGANKSFLSLRPRVLLSSIESRDPKVVKRLRKDVCWTDYNFANMWAEQYAQPHQLVWTGKEFDVKDGETTTARTYKYRPVIGAETVFVPSFFFALPSQVEEQTERKDFFDR